MSGRWLGCLLIIPFVVGFIALPFFVLRAGTFQDLKKSIEEKNEAIKKLEEEARKYREEISTRQRLGNTLKEEIQRIERTIEQFKREINITEKRVSKTELEVKTLSFEIREKEISLEKLQKGLSALIQSLSIEDQEPIIAILIKHNVLSDFFKQIDYISFLKENILNSLEAVRKVREELSVKKVRAEEKKSELENLQNNLHYRKKIQEETRYERSEILQTTKNEENKYQELLREQERKRVALEDEIREIEDKIRITIDPSSLPVKGRGILGWPLQDLSTQSCWNGGESFKNCLTQFFGQTFFAAIGGYGGKGHNGADFRADIGTPVLSAENGIVEALGDTDTGCRRASYGKWILIRHSNNLSTLYGHLSEIGVSSGQKLTRGERIGYSGKSGYATGPHLHFGVFAAQAVRIESIRSRVCGRMMTLPIAATNGYLDPLDYL